MVIFMQIKEYVTPKTA